MVLQMAQNSCEFRYGERDHHSAVSKSYFQNGLPQFAQVWPHGSTSPWHVEQSRILGKTTNCRSRWAWA